MNNENDYQPYYSSSLTMVEAKNRLNNAVKISIKTNNTIGKINNLYTIEVAIILGSLDLVKSLLHQRTDIRDALNFPLNLGNLEIAHYITQVVTY